MNAPTGINKHPELTSTGAGIFSLVSDALPLDFISATLLPCDWPPYDSEEEVEDEEEVLGSAVSWPSMGLT